MARPWGEGSDAKKDGIVARLAQHCGAPGFLAPASAEGDHAANAVGGPTDGVLCARTTAELTGFSLLAGFTW